MRLVPVVLLVLAGCLAGKVDSNFRPAVIPKLSELPADRDRRDAVLDASHVTSGPEQGSGTQEPELTKKQRRAVGAAAFAAAVIGSIYSTTENVTLGGSTTIDENELFTPSHPGPDPDDADKTTDTDSETDTALPTDKPLVPWVKLK